MKNYVIILAGGVGSRFEGVLPKQFSEVAGKPVLMHTLTAFYNCPLEMEIILVLHPQYMGLWEQLIEQHNFVVPHKIAQGGKERFHSTKNALALIPGDEDVLVAVHDGVRPFVAKEVIQQAFAQAKEYGAVIPAISTINPIRLRKERHLVALDRSYDRTDILTVQTPQVFKCRLLKKAFEQPYDVTQSKKRYSPIKLGKKTRRKMP